MSPVPDLPSATTSAECRGSFNSMEFGTTFVVTDPIYERRFLALADGRHPLGECCLAVSLGEPFEGYAYKLVAAIIERRQTETI